MANVSRRALARVIAGKLVAPDADEQAVMRELAAYLMEYNMTEDADVILNDIADELYQQTGRLVVEVTSARPLTDAVRAQLKAYLQETTEAGDVEMHESVDESLIGGVIIKTPSAELDLSVKSKLRQLTGLVQ
ncbi:MAG TPA: F0F1 ATP synthase subunit delta [Candidatus Saccharimonadales bacterium]|nr:F0F1 ATP synthase subunit delta [Candidatus Saccharimonadales bacterium]